MSVSDNAPNACIIPHQLQKQIREGRITIGFGSMKRNSMNPTRLFNFAGIYGLLVLLPQYFLEYRIGQDQPPPITHPEYFYGFVGIAVSWQVAFLIIAKDPPRYRLLIIPAMIEKVSFGGAAIVLYLQQRLSPVVLGFATIDLILAGLFLVAYRQLSQLKENNTPMVQ